MQSIPTRRRWFVAAGALLFSSAAIAIAGEVESPPRMDGIRHYFAFKIVPSRAQPLGNALPSAGNVPQGATAVATGSTRAGSTQAGSTRAGSTQEGSTQAVSTQAGQRQFGAFYTHEVHKLARMAAGNAAPVFPASLSTPGAEGRVLVAVVVDENGAALMQSLRIIQASDSAYAQAVRAVLPGYKFIPAEIENVPVRSWVQVPFSFTQAGRGSDSARAPTSDARRAAALQGTADQVRAARSDLDARVASQQRAGASGAFFTFELEKLARLAPGNPQPQYPATLLSSRTAGNVIVSIVVDTTGRADMTTFKVLESSHQLFSDAVREVLPNYRFIPAELGSRKVRSYVNLPFCLLPRAVPPVARAVSTPARVLHCVAVFVVVFRGRGGRVRAGLEGRDWNCGTGTAGLERRDVDCGTLTAGR
jgi:outer membrane biosynthesis protein TonB